MWADRFGAATVPRLAIAFIGGAVMAYGARLAGGCTSGHGISGALQLVPGPARRPSARAITMRLPASPG